MSAHARYEAATSVNGQSSPAEILDAVGALRDYMRSMDAQVKQLIAERERLTAELEQLRERTTQPPWRHEAQRVTDELDQLVRLYEAAGRRRPRASYRSVHPRADEARASDHGAWLKKMMMVMMMAELA